MSSLGGCWWGWFQVSNNLQVEDVWCFYLKLIVTVCLSATSALPPPTIVSNQEEFVLQPNSLFNISCTGKRNVVWAEPLPENSFVFPGYYTATLFIYNVTVENTGYYMCTYETQEGDMEAEPEEDNEAGIYVFVSGECGNRGIFKNTKKQ